MFFKSEETYYFKELYASYLKGDTLPTLFSIYITESFIKKYSYMERGNLQALSCALIPWIWVFTLLVLPTSLESIPEEEFRRPGRRSISEV